MEILKDQDPRLKQVSEEVKTSEIKKLKKTVEEMISTMKEANGLGLSAIQVGLPKRFFIMHDIVDSKEDIVCINPKILETFGNKVKQPEGCLSFPALFLKVPRYDKIVVEFTDLDNKTEVHILEGLIAQVFQHELDHLDGITFDTQVSRLHLNMAKKKQQKLLRAVEI